MAAAAGPGSSASAPSPAPKPPVPAAPAPLEGTIVDTGAGKRPSVRCRTWRAVGSHAVQGDAEAGFVEARGLLSVGGALTTVDLLLRGTLDVGGPLAAKGRLDADGTIRVAGGAELGGMEFHGTMRAGSTLLVHEALVVHGRLDVGGAIRARELSLSGSIQATAGLRAEQLEITFDAASHVGAVRADTVRIVPVRLPPWKRPPVLVADRIEAREADLEGVHCGFLAADTIRLGKDCRVSRAEGKVVERHRSAFVGFYSESARPHGLSW